MTVRALTASVCVFALAAAGPAAASSLSVRPEAQPVPAVRIAVLPVENQTGAAAPTRELLLNLEAALRHAGLEIVGGEVVQRFLSERRLRQTAAIDRQSAQAAADVLGVDAVLITTLETYREAEPPKFGLSMRLVRASEDTTILWADGASNAGNDSAGLLGLGLIETLAPLQDQVLARLSRSLAAFVYRVPGYAAEDCAPGARFAPRVRFRSEALDVSGSASIAVVPFLNATRQRRAGELVAEQFVRQLAASGAFRVIEPGVVRDVLLRYRVVIPGGVNLETTRELLGALEADMVLSGTVLEYEDVGTIDGPRVRFAATLLDAHSGKVLWQSTSYNRGTDGVLLFDLGEVRTGSGLTCRMVNGVTRSMVGRGPGAAGPPDTWAAVHLNRLQPPPARDAESCSEPLPPSALELAPSAIRPPLIDRRPGRLGEAVEPLRAISVRFDPNGGAMLPSDSAALALLARCAVAAGHDVVVRAMVAPTPEQLLEAARRTVDALRFGTVQKLSRERIRLEIRSVSEPSDRVEVLVAVVPGPASRQGPVKAPQVAGASAAVPPPVATGEEAAGERSATAAPAERAPVTPQPVDEARPVAQAEGSRPAPVPGTPQSTPPAVDDARPVVQADRGRPSPPVGTPQPTPDSELAPKPDAEAAARAAAVAARNEQTRLANARYQEEDQVLVKRTAEVAERAAALEEKAKKLAADERALAGPSGKLANVGTVERELAQSEQKQRETERRLEAMQVTLSSNEVRRRADESAAMAELARLRREKVEGPQRVAAEDALRRARQRRLEATTDRVAIQEKQLAAIEMRLSSWERRLEVAGTPQEQLRAGPAGRRQLSRALDGYRPDIQHCVQSQLKRTPDVKRMDGVLELIIDARGRVTRAYTEGTWHGSWLEGCLKDAAQAWRFPASGEEYQLQAPLTVVGKP